MRNPDKYLFQLIKSLSKGEKDSLQRQARTRKQHTDPNYLRLLYAIDEQEVYNEAALLKQFKGEPLTGNFSEAKKTLTKVILKVIRDQGKTADLPLPYLIEDIHTLISRGLGPLALKRIRTAKSEALKVERFTEFQELAELELELMLKQTSKKQFQAGLNKVKKELNQARAKEENLREYKKLKQKYYFEHKKKHLTRGEIDPRILKQWIREPLLESEKQAKSLRARTAFYQNKIIAFHLKRDLQQAFEYQEKLVSLLEKHDFLRNEFIEEYISHLFASALYSLHFGHFKHGLKLLGKLKKTTANSDYLNVKIKRQYFIGLLCYTEDTGDFAPGLKEIGDMERFFTLNRNKMEPVQLDHSCFMISNFLFRAQRYSEALQWIKIITDRAKSPFGQNIQSLAFSLQLLIVFEMGDYDLLDYLSNANLRKMKRVKPFYELELVLTKLLRKLIKAKNPTELKSRIKTFKGQYEKLLKNKNEQNGENNLGLNMWIESKLSRKSIASLLEASSGKGIDKDELATELG